MWWLVNTRRKLKKNVLHKVNATLEVLSFCGYYHCYKTMNWMTASYQKCMSKIYIVHCMDLVESLYYAAELQDIMHILL